MIVYADAAATTRISPAASRAMRDAEGLYGNPSSTHFVGQKSREAIEIARAQIAGCINAHPNEIFFTSGGSESDNWAVYRGSVQHRGAAYSAIEHHAVSSAVCFYSAWHNVLKPNDIGVIEPETIRNLPNPVAGFISVMTANNEIGTIQPISELAYEAHRSNAIFHTDAVQAVGHIPIDVKSMGVDMLSASAHKFHGPKGVGFLYVRGGTAILPYIIGGHQERNMRAGTENVQGIVGMAAALCDACARMPETMATVREMRQTLILGIMSSIPGAQYNGAPCQEDSLPGIVNFCFDGVDGETLVVLLSERGIMASSGSACMSGDREPSHVLTAIGRTDEQARSALRISIDETNTDEEIDYILKTLPVLVSYLRKASPKRSDP